MAEAISDDSSLPTERAGIWYWEGITLAGLFGIGLLLWPFLAFGAIFMFDSPYQSRSDEVHRDAVAFFIWFYPLTYGAACLLYYVLRRCGIGRLAGCFVWGLPVAVYFILLVVMGWQNVKELNSKRIQLLYQTDPVALLAGCRGVMTNLDSFAKDRKNDSFIDLKDPKIPAVISALRPTYLAASKDWVSLGLHDGMDRLVVVAYSEQSAVGRTNDSSGLLLAPGLWFHDCELSYQQTDRAEFLKKLKALKPEGAPTPNW